MLAAYDAQVSEVIVFEANVDCTMLQAKGKTLLLART